MKVTRSAWRRIAQAVFVGAAVIFLAALLKRHWQELRQIPIAIDAGALVAASALWLAAFGFLVWLWAVSLRWWKVHFPAREALRSFFVSNLARYIPGTVWQFAGLAAMSASHGVPPLIATGAMILLQVTLLGTGVVLALAFAPALMGSAAQRFRLDALPLESRIAFALLALGILAWGLPRLLPPLQRALRRFGNVTLLLPSVTAAQLALYVASAVVGWLAYGVAFWLFARGLLGELAPTIGLAMAAYIASNVAGIVVVVAPGGLGVREAAMVAALTPTLGVERALLLAVASRVWMVALEIIGAMTMLALPATPIRESEARRRADNEAAGHKSSAEPPGA